MRQLGEALAYMMIGHMRKHFAENPNLVASHYGMETANRILQEIEGQPDDCYLILGGHVDKPTMYVCPKAALGKPSMGR
jgi:hypothetical protein